MIIEYHKYFTRSFERLPLKLQNKTQEAIRKFEKNPLLIFANQLNMPVIPVPGPVMPAQAGIQSEDKLRRGSIGNTDGFPFSRE